MSTDIKKVDAKFGDPHSIARYFIKKKKHFAYIAIYISIKSGINLQQRRRWRRRQQEQEQQQQ